MFNTPTTLKRGPLNKLGLGRELLPLLPVEKVLFLLEE